MIWQLRNAVFAVVAQRAIRRVARDVFEHLHDLDMSYHLAKNTGTVSRIIDRGGEASGRDERMRMPASHGILERLRILFRYVAKCESCWCMLRIVDIPRRMSLTDDLPRVRMLTLSIDLMTIR